jgi:hypothetical protein
MTLPIILGFGMTVSYWIVYRLKARRLRKWGGLAIAILGVWALISAWSMSVEWFLASLIIMHTGTWLFEERDLFSEEAR